MTKDPNPPQRHPADTARLKIPDLRLRLIEAVTKRIEDGGDVDKDAIAVCFHSMRETENIDPNRLDILEEKVRRLEELEYDEAPQEDSTHVRLGP